MPSADLTGTLVKKLLLLAVLFGFCSIVLAGDGETTGSFNADNTLATQYLKILFGECLINTSKAPCSLETTRSFIMVIMGVAAPVIQGLFVAVLLWILFYGAVKNATEGRFLGNWDKFKVPASIIVSVLLMANIGGVFFSQILFVKMSWWGSRTADEMWSKSVDVMTQPTLLGSGIPELAHEYFNSYAAMRLCSMQLMKGRGFMATSSGGALIDDETAQQALGRDVYAVCGVDRYFHGNPEFGNDKSLQVKMNTCFRAAFDRMINEGYIRLSEKTIDTIGSRWLLPSETLTPFYVDQQMLLYGADGKPSLRGIIGRLEAPSITKGLFLFTNGSVAACIVDQLSEAGTGQEIPTTPIPEAGGEFSMLTSINQSTNSWANLAILAVLSSQGSSKTTVQPLGKDLGWLVAGREQQLVASGIKQYTANLKLQPPIFRFDEMGRDFRNRQIQAAMAITLNSFAATTFGLPNVRPPSVHGGDAVASNMTETAQTMANPATALSGGYRIGSFRAFAQALGEAILREDAALAAVDDPQGASPWSVATQSISALVSKVATEKAGTQHNVNSRGATKFLQKKIGNKDLVYMMGFFLANIDLWPALIMTFAGIMWLIRSTIWYMLCPLAVTLMAIPNSDVGHNAWREMMGVAWSPVIIIVMFIASLFLWDICILLGWDILMNDGAHPLQVSTGVIQYLTEMVLTGQYLMNFLAFVVVVFSSFFMCAMLPIHGTDLVLRGLGLRGSVAEIGSDELTKLRGALSMNRMGV